MKKFYFLLVLIATAFAAQSQTTIFSENMGTPAATTVIASYTGWQNNGTLTFGIGGAGNTTTDVRTSSASTTYAGASGGGNVFFTTTTPPYGFSIESINAAAYTGLTLQFGYRKESSTALAALAVDFWDGSAWQNVPFTFNEAATAATGWYLSPVINLPVAAQINGLKIRWVKSGTIQFRLDDVVLKGTAGSSPSISVGTLSDFGSVNVGSSSASQNFSVTAANLTGAPGVLTVTAPSADFQVSNNNSTWGATTTIAYTTATLASTPVYVRFTPQSAGAKSGNVTVSGGGATTASVPVAGTGTIAPPSVPVATAATGITSSGFTANWNAAAGATGYFLDVYTLATTTGTTDVAGWNMAVNTTAAQTADLGNANNVGIQTLTVVGANSAVSYPAGPSGSSGTPNPYSVSTNGWDNGADAKYWQISVNTTGTTGLTLSSLQGSSATGPSAFKVQYSIGSSGTWTDIAGSNVTLTTAVSPGTLSTWGALTNLALPAAIENQPLVYIRWIMTSNNAINASPVASGGTSRISGIYLKANGGTVTVPVYVAGYQNLSVNNVTTYNVTGLNPSATYYYVVRATNAGGTTANSNEISVTTASTTPPAITASTLTAFGPVCINASGGPSSFTITGSNLTNADVVVAGLAGYTFSTTSGGTYTSTLTIPQGGGAFSQTVFVKFNPTAVQSYNGNISISGGGIAAPVTVAASGSGINTPASVSTGVASSISTSSATVAGAITATGCATITAYGIEYSTTSGFVNGTQVPSTNLSGSNFTSGLSTLAPSTVYYYKAYATSSNGTVYGSEASFTTTAVPVPTMSASSLTAFGNVCVNTTAGPNSFTLTGSNLTTANVVVGPLAGYTFSTTSGGTYTSTLTIPQTGGTFSQNVFVNFVPTAVQSYNGNIPVSGGGLTAPVTVAASGAGVNTMATVATGAATATFNSATAAGSISANGCSAVTAYGIEFSTTNNFIPGTGTQVASTNLAGGNFTSALSTLASSTVYYFRAYATNAGGTAYGAQQSFTTAAPPAPAVTAGTVTGFGSVTVGTSSASQSFTISGANLTGAPGVITITAPSTDFQVSNNNTTWGASTTIPYTTATLASTPVYVRFTPQSAGAKSGNLSITGGGLATAVTVAVSGTGVLPPPPSAPVATAATGITPTSFTANWNAVAGATGYRLDVYTLGTAAGTIDVAGWNFGVSSAASQTADLGNANNIGVQTVSLNPGNTGTVSWPAGPSGASGMPNPFSVSANGWDNGADTKYWQINLNTTGVSNMTLSSLQGSSNTGPANFKVQYKVGASGTWTDITGGTVTLTTAVAAANLATWGAITNLPLPAAVNNQPLVSIRWISTSNTAVNGSTVAATGTSRISGIYVRAASGTVTVPVYLAGYQNLAVGNVTSQIVTGLTPTTAYYYVVRAENGTGVSVNSNEISVTTAAVPPPALTVTAVPGFGSVCGGSTAGPASLTITGANLTTAPVTVGPLAGYSFSTTSTGPFAPTLSLTQPGGTYTQTIYVVFSPIASGSYNGNIPVSGGGAAGVLSAVAGTGTSPVATGTATDLTTHSVVLNGLLNNAGCLPVIEYGFEYSGINGFVGGTGTNVTASNLVSGSGAYSAMVDGLVQGVTYYFRAYARNAGGKFYGAQQSFTVQSIPNNFTVYPVPVNKGGTVRFSQSNLAPGYYGLTLYNSMGQQVFYKAFNVQSNFINEQVTLPASLSGGIYRLQLINTTSVLSTRTILID